MIKGKNYTFFIASTPGKLRKLIVPAYALHGLAVLALILFPFVWLVSLPLRLVGITLEAVFALLRALLFLPARLLGWRRCQRHAV